MNAPKIFARNTIITVFGACFLGGTTLLPAAAPKLNLETVTEGLKISWDAPANTDSILVLQQTDDLDSWTDVTLSITQPGAAGTNQVLVPTGEEAMLYRLIEDPALPNKQPAYVGANACSGCHGGPFGNQYNEWVDSGHPYKLNEVVGGVPPTYFSTGATNVPNTPPHDPAHPELDVEWSDVSWVIGGAIWKARFVDHDGYIITGENVQFNLQTGGWANYHTENARGTKPYNCGSCHTTGWVSTDDGSVNQAGVPGMHGSYAATGIECEACHGPASRHLATGFGPGEKAAEIVKDTSAALCGSCHVRGSIDTIPASGGATGDFTSTFIRHHEQYNELLASPGHSGHDCVTCHDPHKSVKLFDKDGIHTACIDCHNNDTKVEGDPGYGTVEHNFAADDHGGEATCIDCHMPRAGKSAVAVNTYTGDIKTHIFTINPLKAGVVASMFEEDINEKKWVALDGSGKSAGVTLDFVCYKCHTDHEDDVGVGNAGVGGGTAPQLNLSTLEGAAMDYHKLLE